jgi:hypothetical protein
VLPGVPKAQSAAQHIAPAAQSELTVHCCPQYGIATAGHDGGEAKRKTICLYINLLID